MIEGSFIVLDGIDGSGTTTQAAAIRDRFTASGLPAHVTAEPSGGPVGSLIRQVLTGRLVVNRQGRSAPPNWATMALLFAADRQDHVESEISPNLRDGVNVICDRYIHSSIAYQSASSNSEDAVAWIKEINKHVRRPDLVLYLKVNPEEAMRRRTQRDLGPELYEDHSFQRRLGQIYDTLASDAELPMVTIDANLTQDEVTETCWAEIQKFRNTGA